MPFKMNKKLSQRINSNVDINPVMNKTVGAIAEEAESPSKKSHKSLIKGGQQLASFSPSKSNLISGVATPDITPQFGVVGNSFKTRESKEDTVSVVLMQTPPINLEGAGCLPSTQQGFRTYFDTPTPIKEEIEM